MQQAPGIHCPCSCLLKRGVSAALAALVLFNVDRQYGMRVCSKAS